MKISCFVNLGGGFNNVLVIGADAVSRNVDWTDRGSCILFGDGAGAVLVQALYIYFDLHIKITATALHKIVFAILGCIYTVFIWHLALFPSEDSACALSSINFLVTWHVFFNENN